MKSYTLNSKLLLLMGFFSTSPVLAIVVGNFSISLFAICFILYILVNMVGLASNPRITFKKTDSKKYVLLWLILSAMSCIFGLVYYISNNEWFNSSVNYLIKTVIYVFFSLIVLNGEDESESILKGILCGVIVNLIWVAIDSIVFYVFNISLTNTVFASYITANNIRYGSIDTFDEGLIRPAGFNDDPASIGLFAPLLLGYGLRSRKPIWTLLALSSIVFSGSTTSAVCCTVVLVCYFLEKLRFKKTQRERLTRGKFFLICVVIIMAIFALYRAWPVITSRTEMISSRFNHVYGSQSSEDNARIEYLKEIPKALGKQGFKVITGTGFNSASEGFLGGHAVNLVFRKAVDQPFDMENLYLAYFFDNGIIGFIIFVLMLISLYRSASPNRFPDENDKYSCVGFSALVAMLLSSFFYHYTLYSLHILIFLAIALKSSGTLPKSERSNNVSLYSNT